MKDINFQGNLYVIDTNTEVLEYVKEKYKMLIPNAKIICINKSFEDAFDDVPNKFDLFLANHCIDDMIIAEFMQNYYDDNLKNDNFKDILTEAWIELGKDTTKIEEISNKIFSAFKKFFLSKEIANIIMSQYKSNLYFKEDFNPFNDDERYSGQYLLDNTQNAKNWIVGNVI